MFTGLVQHAGSVTGMEIRDFGLRLHVATAEWVHRPSRGDSIAVNGCCLTVAEPTSEANGMLAFDVIAQTLSVTTLGSLQIGDRVNLEHAVTPITLLGGHIVQGHVDGVGRVMGVERKPAEHRLRIRPPERGAMALIVDKGSIAVSGVSLTVAATGPEWFEVALIPTTLGLTNLGSLRVGDPINLEYDYIAKVVTNWLARRERR
jgi:riboflavin synthase